MPNYCINKVKVSSSDKEELTRFKENILDEGFDFEKIIPYPIDAPLEAKEEHEKKNDITHQNEWTQWYSDIGYHWCSEAWGTKWNRIGLKINKLKPIDALEPGESFGIIYFLMKIIGIAEKNNFYFRLK